MRVSMTGERLGVLAALVVAGIGDTTLASPVVTNAR